MKEVFKTVGNSQLIGKINAFISNNLCYFCFVQLINELNDLEINTVLRIINPQKVGTVSANSSEIEKTTGSLHNR